MRKSVADVETDGHRRIRFQRLVVSLLGTSGREQLSRQSASSERGKQCECIGFAITALRDNGDLRLFCLWCADHHREALDSRGPSDRRRVGAAERFDESVIAAAGQDGAL